MQLFYWSLDTFGYYSTQKLSSCTLKQHSIQSFRANQLTPKRLLRFEYGTAKPLSSTTRPDAIYSHLVHTTTQIRCDAQTHHSGFPSYSMILENSNSMPTLALYKHSSPRSAIHPMPDEKKYFDILMLCHPSSTYSMYSTSLCI